MPGSGPASSPTPPLSAAPARAAGCRCSRPAPSSQTACLRAASDREAASATAAPLPRSPARRAQQGALHSGRQASGLVGGRSFEFECRVRGRHAPIARFGTTVNYGSDPVGPCPQAFQVAGVPRGTHWTVDAVRPIRPERRRPTGPLRRAGIGGASAQKHAPFPRSRAPCSPGGTGGRTVTIRLKAAWLLGYRKIGRVLRPSSLRPAEASEGSHGGQHTNTHRCAATGAVAGLRGDLLATKHGSQRGHIQPAGQALALRWRLKAQTSISAQG